MSDSFLLLVVTIGHVGGTSAAVPVQCAVCRLSFYIYILHFTFYIYTQYTAGEGRWRWAGVTTVRGVKDGRVRHSQSQHSYTR